MKNNKLFWFLFIMAILVLFAIIYINLGFFQNIMVRGITTFGYPAIFIFIFIIDLFESPFNPELIASLGVILGLNVLLVFIFAATADFLGGLTSFYIGRKYLSTKVMNSCSTNKNYQKYCKFFYKYGRLALLVAMLTPLPNIIFVWLAGSFQMRLRDFIIFGSLPGILRIGIILLSVKGIISLF